VAQINSKLTPSGSVTVPASGSVAFFTEEGDGGRLYIKDSDGNVYPAASGSGGGSSLIPIQNDGSSVGSASTLNFSGSAVESIGISGGVATFTFVTGSASGSGSSGSSGANGTSGSSGADGATGTSGSSGADGTSGSSGADGTSGSSGATGAAGAPGTSGSSGESGTSGSSGANGTSGSSGADGTSGSSGATGAAGAPGTSGSSGADGTSGSSGESGTSGSSGESGTSGSSGESGTSGSSGADGTSGSSGADGTSGSSGADGATGNPGTSGSSGADGTSGSSGEQGIQGNPGTSGSSGEDGATGNPGTSGSSGANGTSGSSGEDGATGNPGTSGSSGANGTSGSSGETGAAGAAGTSGSSGSSGATGAAGAPGTSGSSGADGAGGGASYNPVVRYEVSSGNKRAQLLSSGNVEGGLTWSRSSTTLTVTHTAHGLSAGDFVVIRNMSEDYSYLEIQTVPNVNSFTLTVANSGGTSGTEGAYIPAFDVSSLTNTALTIVSPSAGNAQLISMVVFLDQMEDSSITVTVPSNSITNGAGKNNSLNSRVPASFDFYDVSGATSSKVGSATLSFSTTTNHNVYSLSGGLDVFGDVLYTLQF